MAQQTYRKWTAEEESKLFAQIKAFPQNLSKCFLLVAEDIGRSPSAVQAHWYTVTSKKPQYVGFVTVSGKHKSVNRKNGMGERSTEGIFKRILRLLGITV